jgi:hypothetical protein
MSDATNVRFIDAPEIKQQSVTVILSTTEQQAMY